MILARTGPQGLTKVRVRLIVLTNLWDWAKTEPGKSVGAFRSLCCILSQLEVTSVFDGLNFTILTHQSYFPSFHSVNTEARYWWSDTNGNITDRSQQVWPMPPKMVMSNRLCKQYWSSVYTCRSVPVCYIWPPLFVIWPSPTCWCTSPVTYWYIKIYTWINFYCYYLVINIFCQVYTVLTIYMLYGRMYVVWPVLSFTCNFRCGQDCLLTCKQRCTWQCVIDCVWSPK